MHLISTKLYIHSTTLVILLWEWGHSQLRISIAILTCCHLLLQFLRFTITVHFLQITIQSYNFYKLQITIFTNYKLQFLQITNYNFYKLQITILYILFSLKWQRASPILPARLPPEPGGSRGWRSTITTR